MKLKYTLASLLFSVSVASSLADDVPAFPGAEGFARYATTGGRTTTTGRVYHVTRLADDTMQSRVPFAPHHARSSCLRSIPVCSGRCPTAPVATGVLPSRSLSHG